MRIGVGTGTIRNVVVSNIVIEHSGRGLHLQNCYGPVSTGVSISDVSFSNIIIRNTPNPIMVSSGTENSIGYLKNISFSNINILSEGQIVIAGFGKTRVSNVSFSNIYFECLPNTLDVSAYSGSAKMSIENSVFKVKSADNIRFNNVVVANNPIPTLASIDASGICGEIKEL